MPLKFIFERQIAVGETQVGGMEKFSKKNEILRSRGFDPGTIRLPVEDLTNRAIERLDSSPLRFPYILDIFDGFFKCSKVNFNPHCTHFSHLHSL